MQHLFVMTYGRSGSTLLMGVLNSIPGYLIRGENQQAMRHLHAFHRTCVQEKQRRRSPRTRQSTHPWFGIAGFDETASLTGIRSLAESSLLRPDADTRVTGFKEIRWYHEDLADYVAWLQEVFPGCRFVVNTRNLDDVAASGWWAKHENATGVLTGIETRLLDVAKGLGDAAHHVHYDDFVADPTSLQGLFDWLGEPFDEERVRSTMAVRHSVVPRAQRQGGGR